MSNNTLYANVNELYLTYLLNGGMKSIKPESHYSSLRDCADIFFETDKGTFDIELFDTKINCYLF